MNSIVKSPCLLFQDSPKLSFSFMKESLQRVMMDRTVESFLFKTQLGFNFGERKPDFKKQSLLERHQLATDKNVRV